MRRQKLLIIMYFLALAAETDYVRYAREMWTPMAIFGWFTTFLPIKMTPFEVGCILMLLTTRRKGAVSRPIIRSIYVSAVALLFVAIYGLASGGLLQPIYTQAHVWLFTLLFALTAATVLTKVEDFHQLNSAVVYVAIWRSFWASVFYLNVKSRTEKPECMTTHEDTMLFVVALIILLSRTIELRTKRAWRMLAIAGPLILLGIQVNNRRIAWASMIGGLLVTYFMLPTKSAITRRVNRYVIMALPILAIYVGVGWGRTERAFAPLTAISSMGVGKIDNSTKARNVENLGMITMIDQRPLLGTGFGHQWLELESTYTVSTEVFPMYHYSPHNSILALLAFCGALGFAALWVVLPLSVYHHARAYRYSQDPIEKTAAITGIVIVVAYLNQAYGDMAAMDNAHMILATMLGSGLACAARQTVTSGAQPAIATTRHKRGSATPRRAQ